MKGILIISFVLSCLSMAFAQQLPLGSQYYTNMFTINPAYSAMGKGTKAFVSHRSQFNGLQGGPQTSMLAVNGATNDKKIGLGVIAYSDKTDILVKTSGMINYSYGLKLTPTQMLHFGLAVGVQNFRIDFDESKVVNTADPILFGPRQSKTVFNADFGLLYQANRFQLGFAIPQMISNKPSFSSISTENLNFQTRTHFRVSAQYELPVNSAKTLRVIPLVMTRVVAGAPVQYDLSAVLDHKNIGWIGLMYHSNSAIAFSAGFRYKNLSVGYAHDLSIGVVNRYAQSSSEFILSYTFGNNNRVDPLLEERLKDLEEQNAWQRNKLDSLEREQNRIEEEIKENVQGLNEKYEGQQEEIDSLKKVYQQLQNEMKDVEKKAQDASNKVNEQNASSKKGNTTSDNQQGTEADTKNENVNSTNTNNNSNGSKKDKNSPNTTNQDAKKEDKPNKKTVTNTNKDSAKNDEIIGSRGREGDRERYYIAPAENYIDENGGTPVKGFYIIIGSFEVKENAINWKNKSIVSGHTETGILMNKNINMREVIVFYTKNKEEAFGKLSDFKDMTEKTWVLELE